MNTIEQLQKEIKILKEAMNDTNNEFVNTAYAEELEEKEQQLFDLLEQPTEEEYAERQQQEYDTMKDLENEQI